MVTKDIKTFYCLMLLLKDNSVITPKDFDALIFYGILDKYGLVLAKSIKTYNNLNTLFNLEVKRIEFDCI